MGKRIVHEILFENEDVVAVNKPAHLAVIPGRGESTSLIEQLAEQLKLPCKGTEDPRLRVVHRLDKDTSGVMLFAKNINAQRHLSHQFQNNTVKKEYLAIVHGRPGEMSGRIGAKLSPDPNDKRKMAVDKHGKPAITDWQVEVMYKGMALIRAFPRTGKTHQIRVHLKSIGLPLAVDDLYNPRSEGVPTGIFLSNFKRDYRPTRGEDERPLISRLTLHAQRITFSLPSGEEKMVECPLPKDLRATINCLGKYAARR